MKKLFALNIFILIFFIAVTGCSRVGKEVKSPTGLIYIDEVIGDGPPPVKGQILTVHFTGTFTDGTKFDDTHERGKPVMFKIGNGTVMPGWEEGLMTMKAGGKRKLIIPPDLAYGEKGVEKVIPPNSTLIYEVELLSIK